MQKFMCLFAHVRYPFRLPELESVAKMCNVPVKYDPHEASRLLNTDHHDDTPFLEVELPSEDAAKKIAARSVLVRAFLDVWAVGKTYEDLFEKLKALPQSKIAPFAHESVSFKMYVDGFGRHFTTEEQVEIMERFSFLDFKGPVNLTNPDHTFWVFLDVGRHVPADVPPKRIFFARQVAGGVRDLIDRFNLKKRTYLGTTSMDSELALIMANQAMATPGSLVYDPFVGTGGLLLPCANFGALTLGSDIDIRVLRGKDKEHSVMGNFQQYGLTSKFLGVVHCDLSITPWRNSPLFDAIITDPPYGVRAGARKVGRKNRKKYVAVPPEFADVHMPSTTAYTVPDMLADLLKFAAQRLTLGGRLVYWLPTTLDYKEEDVPLHPCFKLVANSEQIITTRFRRRLITMEKVLPYKPEEHDSYKMDIKDPTYADFNAKIFSPDPEKEAKKERKKLKKKQAKQLKKQQEREQRLLQQQQQNAQEPKQDGQSTTTTDTTSTSST